MQATHLSPHRVGPTQPATVLLVDLRNFTPNLNAAEPDEHGVSGFCHFLSEFYAVCLDACITALPPELRAEPPLYLSSTGDGVLVVFTHAENVRQGYLAATLLHQVLRPLCERYNEVGGKAGCPRTSFGIGIESGEVNRITSRRATPEHPPIVDTYIGQCINVAARAEGQTKTFHDTQTIVAAGANEKLCLELYGTSYTGLVERALDLSITDQERLEAHDRMNSLNRSLCVAFLYHFALKGVETPMALFRIANTSARLGNPRFEALLDRLTDGPGHRAEVAAAMAKPNKPPS